MEYCVAKHLHVISLGLTLASMSPGGTEGEWISNSFSLNLSTIIENLGVIAEVCEIQLVTSHSKAIGVDLFVDSIRVMKLLD